MPRPRTDASRRVRTFLPFFGFRPTLCSSSLDSRARLKLQVNMQRHVLSASRNLRRTAHLPTASTRAPLFPARRDLATASYYQADVAGLTEEQAELREAVKGFADAEVAPVAEKTDKDNAFPNVLSLQTGLRHSLIFAMQSLWPKLGEMGLVRPEITSL